MESTGAADLDNTEPYSWTDVANVEPLVLSGIELSATSISLYEDIAFVTYHKRGDLHLGALELIDLTNPDIPYSLGFIPFEGYDINAVAVDAYEDGVVWVAGSSNKIGASLFKLVFSRSYFLQAYDRINLSKALVEKVSASANGIYLSRDHIYVSAGKSYGGIFKVSRHNINEISVSEFTGAKAVTGNEYQGAEYYASLAVNDQSEIRIRSVLDERLQLEFNSATSAHQSVDLPHDGKYELVFSPTNPVELYFTSGSLGVSSIDIRNGSILKETALDLLPNGNTNSLSIDDEFIYLANGEDGLSIATVQSAESSGVISPVFHWDLPEKPASVNFVTAADGYVFVAKGLGGFHILKYEETQLYDTELPFDQFGTPIGMVDRDYCPETITDILTTILPAGQNALTHSPEYFDNPNSSFFLERDAQVEVTFLHEGAGFKNTLGYYTYPSSNPPRSIAELKKRVIFPNASASRSGGSLIPGNTVEVLGEFPAGTVFGFFLIAHGWQNKITDGHYTHYSDWEFNENSNQQNLIFYDQDCDAFVLCFEDIKVPGGDKDFNDVIFQVSSTPSEAFRKTAYLQIR